VMKRPWWVQKFTSQGVWLWTEEIRRPPEKMKSKERFHKDRRILKKSFSC
jgi:hypothetical protein